MKYGYLTISYKHTMQFPHKLISKLFYVGLGDIIQGFGVRAFYAHMGIPERDIIPVDFEDLAVYRGEDVILPLNFHMVGGVASSFPPSPNILPIFFGFHIAYDIFPVSLYGYIDYYNMFSPIGCRDIGTCESLRALGVDAYVSGCSSFFLPRRLSPVGSKGTVFISDLSPELEALVPDEVKKNAIYESHAVYDPQRPLTVESRQLYEEMTWEKFKRYATEARLVVTNRMHIASPCVAMGIPVILGKGSYGAGQSEDIRRYTWLYSIIKPYDVEEFKNIDWDNPPQPLVDVEKYKFDMMGMMKKRMSDALRCYESGEFFKLRPKILESTLMGFEQFQKATFYYADETIQAFRNLMGGGGGSAIRK